VGFPEARDAGAATSLRPPLEVLNQMSRPEVLDCFRGDERKKNRSAGKVAVVSVLVQSPGERPLRWFLCTLRACPATPVCVRH
jgi:hypothetical protein